MGGEFCSWSQYIKGTRSGISCFLFCTQILYKLLKYEKVNERSKHRLKLKDIGYQGFISYLNDIPVSMLLSRCLLEQVLASGKRAAPVEGWFFFLCLSGLYPGFNHWVQSSLQLFQIHFLIPRSRVLLSWFFLPPNKALGLMLSTHSRNISLRHQASDLEVLMELNLLCALKILPIALPDH